MRKACLWQRKGGVVDHQAIDIAVHNAGLGAGDAEGARRGALFVAPAKALWHAHFMGNLKRQRK
jgi:hypothetical protein